MATYTLVPLPRIGITPEAGMLCYTYAAGGSSAAATYTDSIGSAVNSNPVVADGFGLFPAIYLPLGTSYKFVFTHGVTNVLPPDPVSNIGVVIFTQDGIASVPSSSPALDIMGTAGENLLANANVYLSDGSGGKQAGLWYNADGANAYSSVDPFVGFATGVILSGMTGTIRVGGNLGGFTALSAGSTYYVGTTGVPTITPGTNARIVGQADTTTSMEISANPPSTVPILNDFRLTLTTGVPVTVSDVTAAGTLFCTPYVGNRITLFGSSGGAKVFTSAQFSIAIPASTSQMYDVFCYNNSGTPTLEVLAWTNDTTRATAIVLTTTGAYTKSGDLTRRYLGSFRTTAVANQTEDSMLKRYLYNHYNQVRRPLQVFDTTNSWNWDTTSWHQANASAANQVDLVVGVACAHLWLALLHAGAGGSSVTCYAGIGEDVTNAPLLGSASPIAATVGTNIGSCAVHLSRYPAVGRHIYTWLEFGAGATTTFYGDNGGTNFQSGMQGFLEG